MGKIWPLRASWIEVLFGGVNAARMMTTGQEFSASGSADRADKK